MAKRDSLLEWVWALGGTAGDEGTWADFWSRGRGRLRPSRVGRMTAAGSGDPWIPSDRKDEE